jgi:SAM-dependent MidA family methyltransferase
MVREINVKLSPLRQKIAQEIRERGPIPFSRYMEVCLYDPEFGYYSRNAEQFGKAGDFYTSSDVHAVFGRLMARQFDEMWRALGSPEKITLVELGPGRGLFAQDVLDWSEKKFPNFFESLRCVLVERSPALRQRIENTLCHRFQSGKVQFSSFPIEDQTPNDSNDHGLHDYDSSDQESGDDLGQAAERRKNSAHGASRGLSASRAQAPEGRKKLPLTKAAEQTTPIILFANEFFDAIPVEILSPQGSLRIDSRDGHFLEIWAPSSLEELEFLDRYSVHPARGERIEGPLIAQHFMQRVAAGIPRGFIVAIDYGYTREEQLAGRHRGTLKAIRQHSIGTNPYEAPGEQDITADVNFTALAAAAEEQGMQAQKLLTQSQFLMGIGEANQFADAFEECRVPQEHAKVALQLKHLVTPAGMGESFHVFVASKGIEKERVSALAGLSFGHKQSSSR